MSKLRLLSEVTQAVLPTATLLLTVHVEDYSLLAMEFKNQDATQTLEVEVRRRCSRTGDYSVAPLLSYGIIQPGATHAADLDVRGSVDVQFWGTASGAGLNCRSAGMLSGDV